MSFHGVWLQEGLQQFKVEMHESFEKKLNILRDVNSLAPCLAWDRCSVTGLDGKPVDEQFQVPAASLSGCLASASMNVIV